MDLLEDDVLKLGTIVLQVWHFRQKMPLFWSSTTCDCSLSPGYSKNRSIFILISRKLWPGSSINKTILIWTYLSICLENNRHNKAAFLWWNIWRRTLWRSLSNWIWGRKPHNQLQRRREWGRLSLCLLFLYWEQVSNSNLWLCK